VNGLGELLGSSTRGNIVEALALSQSPLTAYRIAKRYNMNMAKVYLEMKRLERLRVVTSSPGGRGQEYELVDGSLRTLALKFCSRVKTYEAWRSSESRRERFRMGLAVVPRFKVGARASAPGVKTRLPGELENLAVLGRKKFDLKYSQTAGNEYDTI
jgi:hypothetical protein